MKTTILLAFSLPLLAADSPVTPMPPAAAVAFPQEFLTAGGQYTSKATPHYTGWLAAAKLMSQANGTYSFTGMYIIPQKDRRVSTTLTSGAAQFMRTAYTVRLYAIAAAGMSTTSTPTAASTTSIGMALNGGVLAVVPIRNGYSIDVLSQVVKGATGTNVVVGVGFGWGR